MEEKASRKVTNMCVASAIISIRKSREWDQQRLAQESNIPQATLSRIESGRGCITVKQLVNIADSLDVEPGQITSFAKEIYFRFINANKINTLP